MKIRISKYGGVIMIKVKTFTNELKALHAMTELHELDKEVNQFIQDNSVGKVVSVSDTCTTGDGSTIGIIRILTYETA
jgi:hypothetical protein